MSLMPPTQTAPFAFTRHTLLGPTYLYADGEDKAARG